MKYTPIAVILDSKEEKKARKLERIVIQTNDKEGKSEDWLQNLIFENPDLLAVKELSETFTPLIPIGREISLEDRDLGTACIDNLYISPRGKLTIVETKLWKNPEQHRTVVAQVIEYAQKISKWDYYKLEQEVIKSLRKYKQEEIKSLDEYVSLYLKKKHERSLDIKDERFSDKVNSNLKNGEFLLLIVGDKISPNVAFLSEKIHSAPGLGFKIYLVELQLYSINKEEKWPLLVISHVVGKTVEKTRAIVKIKYEKEEPKSEVTSEEPSSQDKKDFIELLREYEADESLIKFFNKITKEMKNIGCVDETLKASCVIKLPDSNSKSKQKFTLFGISKDGTLYLGNLTEHLINVGIAEQIGFDFFNNVSQLFNKGDEFDWRNVNGKITLKDVEENYEEFVNIIKTVIEEINSAVRVAPITAMERFYKKISDDSKKEIYTKFVDLWKQKHMKVEWHKTGILTLKVKSRKKDGMVYRSWPGGGGDVKLIKEKDLKNFGNAKKAYQTYVVKVKDIEEVQEILNKEDKACISHDSINEKELELILNAITDFAEEVMDKN